MSLVLAVPMYGGNCCAEFAHSLSKLQTSLSHAGIDHRLLVHTNDSLVMRARNCLVARFLRDPELAGFDRFLFLDADIDFQPEDVAKLWNLDVDVACAAYPVKREPTVTTAWKDGKLVELDQFEGPTSIDYAGTGFLMIKRQVFERLQAAHPEAAHTEGQLGLVYALFDTQVIEEEGEGEPWTRRWYCSEDYLFCRRWRELGGEIVLEPSIRLGHVGRKVYR